MNLFFKVVFNKARGIFVVGSEIIKSHGRSKKLKSSVAAMAVVTLISAASNAVATEVSWTVSNETKITSGWGGLADFDGSYYSDAAITLTNALVKDNTITVTEGKTLHGGMADLYKINSTINDSTFSGNKTSNPQCPLILAIQMHKKQSAVFS